MRYELSDYERHERVAARQQNIVSSSAPVANAIFADTFSAPTKTLRVDLESDEIIVRRPGTALMLAYSKSAEQPRLVLTRSWMKPTTPCPTEEFWTGAFQAAVSKARELKWIA
jgi:hypothetical protein